MEIDPMNSLVNVMSKLEKDEAMVVQLVCVPPRLLGIINFPRGARSQWWCEIKRGTGQRRLQ